MAKQRYINTKFWSDGFVTELEPLEKYVFLYLLTNEHTNICGIYELPLKIIAFETGINPEKISEILIKLKSKIQYIDGWVHIINFAKHQEVNSNISLGITNSLKEIPNEILDKFIPYYNPIHRVSIATELSESKLKLKPKYTFSQFWNLYPKKVEKAKSEAKWNKLPEETQKLILEDLPKRILSDQWKKGYILNPMTYLNGQRWNDEIVKEPQQKTYETRPELENWTRNRINQENQSKKDEQQRQEALKKIELLKQQKPIGKSI